MTVALVQQLRASSVGAEVKLFLTLVANQPVRKLLFYILRYEPISQEEFE